MEWEEVRTKFKQVWGYGDFRPPQGEVIANLLAKRDGVVILATGGGKSICFQLPALLQSGLTLVISPLVALMEDQVQDLQRRQLPAATIHSNMTKNDRWQVLKNFGQWRLLYLSPETLFSPPVWEKLCHPKLAIAGIMLDEAHCLVQWGDTFRPAYRRLGALRPALLKHKEKNHPPIPIAAFTATADPQVQSELCACLQLQDPHVILTSPYRQNLALHVEISWSPQGRKERSIKYIRSQQGEVGLVYVRTRKDSEELAAWFNSQGLKCTYYHGGMIPKERRQIEKAWLEGAYSFVVCTSAFGVGINNPKTRWVLHFQSPLTIAEYVQEVGRAGRDGKAAAALMLVSEPTGLLDNTDRNRYQFFLQQQRKIVQRARQLLPKLPRQGTYEEVSRMDADAPAALGLLHRAGKLVWHDPFHYEILPDACSLPAVDETATMQMQQFIRTRRCRWSFLLEVFGFVAEAKTMHCGICDNCLRQKQ
ncbi:MAG: RecQ family ATP-dependent DNA helicase [Pseudanabaenaceae cyanobacterium]